MNEESTAVTIVAIIALLIIVYVIYSLRQLLKSRGLEEFDEDDF